MGIILDRSIEDDIAEAVLDSTEELNVPPESAIPGLMLAARELADQTEDPQQAIDEAIVLLEGGELGDG